MQKGTLVLEGGATRGVFTSGVLDYLMEQDMYMSHVIGVSAGACNAVDYVSRQPGRTKDCMIPTDKSGNYYYGIRKFVKERSLMNMDLIFDIFPNQIYPFDYDTYFGSQIECELVVTNCLTGRAEYLKERSQKERLMKICKKRVSRGMAEVYRKTYRSYPKLVKAILTRSFYYNRTMNVLEKLEREGKIFVLRPMVKPVARLERNKDTLTAFYAHGYQLMEREYTRLKEYLEE